MFFARKTPKMPLASEILPGRGTSMPIGEPHHVSGMPLLPPFPEASRRVQFGMGCFWGAERKFWSMPGASRSKGSRSMSGTLRRSVFMKIRTSHRPI